MTTGTLIPLAPMQVADQVTETVNSRHLYGFLGVRRDHATWIRKRIEQYGFTEETDFVCSPVPGSKGRGGHNRVEYFLSLSMAKELAMVERTSKGRDARQYFIECERRAKASAGAAPAPTDWAAALEDPRTLRELLLSKTSRTIELEEALITQAPKVAGFDRISSADGAISITSAAKTLQVRPRELFSWMYQHGWIYRRTSCGPWVALQPRLNRGQLLHKVAVIDRDDGTQRVAEQVLVTPKGLSRLAELLETPTRTELPPVLLSPSLRR